MSAHKIAPTTFRFHPQVKAALLLIAEQQGRSMANMLEWLIKQYCENEGMGWPPEDSSAKKTKAALKARSRSTRISGHVPTARER